MIQFKFSVSMKVMVLGMSILCMALVGCEAVKNSPALQDSIINTVATDVGYGVYRAVPDARPILQPICLINDFSNPEQLVAALKDKLSQMWLGADKLTETDAQMALLTINNLNGLLDIQLANAKADRAVEILKGVIGGICKGVALASK